MVYSLVLTSAKSMLCPQPQLQKQNCTWKNPIHFYGVADYHTSENQTNLCMRMNGILPAHAQKM